MSSEKSQTPVPKASSTPSGDFKGKRKEPAEEFLEVGPSHGIVDPQLEAPTAEMVLTTTQKQEKAMDNSSKKENTQDKV